MHITRASDGSLKWLSGDLGRLPLAKTSSLASFAVEAHNRLAIMGSVLNIDDPMTELVPVSTHRDDLGSTHIKFAQYHDGIPVWGKDLMMHVDGTGKVYAINGAYSASFREPGVLPSISAEAAETVAREILESEGRWQPMDATTLQWLGMDQEESRLVYLDTEDGPKLAWSLDVRPGLIEWYEFLVDANDGTVLKRLARHCTLMPLDGPAPKVELNLPTMSGAGTFKDATATDLNNQQTSLRVHERDDGSHLMFWDLDNIGTFDLPNLPGDGGALTLTLKGKDLNEDAEIFFVTNGSNSWEDPVAVSAHSNMSQTYEFFKSTFNRKAINDDDRSMLSIIHITDEGAPMDNAFWNGRIMGYGDGAKLFTPLAGAKDVAGHEMTHGVIQFTAGLVYENQPGALNESWADVFGVFIDIEDFDLGEDVMKVNKRALRNLLEPDHPDVLAQQPAHMDDFRNLRPDQDNGGVHVNSGIPNRAAALVINAIGAAKAEPIYYRALTTYLTRTSEFGDARRAVIQSAIDLHGDGTEAAAVRTAFDQVGITDDTGTGDSEKNEVPEVTSGRQIIAYVMQDGSALGEEDGTIAWIDPATAETGVFSGAVAKFNTQITVTQGGDSIWYVNNEGKLYYIDLSTVTDVTTMADWSLKFFPELSIESEGDIQNAAIAPDASRAVLASTKDDDATLYFTNGRTVVPFPLEVETTAEGFSNDFIKYPDVIAWSPNPERPQVAFDALNEAGGLLGGGISYWSVYEIDFDNDRIFQLIPAQAGNVSVGNIVYSSTDPDNIAFNTIDESGDGAIWDTVLGDFEAGKLTFLKLADKTYQDMPIDDAQRPNFSPNDRYVAMASDVLQGLLILDQQENELIRLGFDNAVDAYNPQWFVVNGTVTTNNETTPDLPDVAGLQAAYPNPVTSTATLAFAAVTAGPVSITVYDMLGRPVQRVFDQNVAAGRYNVTMDASQLASGTYVARMVAGEAVSTVKLTVAR